MSATYDRGFSTGDATASTMQNVPAALRAVMRAYDGDLRSRARPCMMGPRSAAGVRTKRSSVATVITVATAP
jgi:hypothetical protein